jgi:hypothetical protein
MLNWFTNAFVSKKFATFFQDGTNFIFDPRVIYDPYWDRFVVIADAAGQRNSQTRLDEVGREAGSVSGVGSDRREIGDGILCANLPAINFAQSDKKRGT